MRLDEQRKNDEDKMAQIKTRTKSKQLKPNSITLSWSQTGQRLDADLLVLARC